MSTTPRLRRDLIVVGGCAAFIVGSLLLVRTLTAPAGDSHTAAAPQPTAIQGSAPTTTPQLAATTPPPTTTSPPANTGRIRGPVRTIALNPGVSITPHAAPPGPATAAPTTGLPTTLPTAGDLPADPATAQDTAAAWITALCSYDWQQPDPTTHQHRAEAYGDITMPPGADPFTFDPAGWTQITRTHQSSACTDTTTTVEPAPADHPGTGTVRITTTQLIAVDDTPIQQMTLHLTRAIEQTDSGRWRIGRPVTAN